MRPPRSPGYEYRALLVALLVVLVVYPALRGPSGAPVLARVLITLMLLAGGWVVFAAHRLWPLAALGGLAALGVWTGYTLPAADGRTVAAGYHGAAAAFQLLVVVVVLRRAYREPVVSADAIAAALCGYLLLGVLFGHLYCLLAAAVPGSFAGLPVGAGAPEVHVQLTYYSFITLTTVGSGDVTPTGDAARSVAIAEVVAGQFYPAVLIADLVSKRVAQALTPADAGPGSAKPPAPGGVPAPGDDVNAPR